MKPKEAPYNYRVAQPLNQEKSQLSLAQVYEEDYLKQTAKEGEAEEKEDERHAEIKKLMEKLFLKLDALSNFRYTPKPVSQLLLVCIQATRVPWQLKFQYTCIRHVYPSNQIIIIVCLCWACGCVKCAHACMQ